MFRKQPEGEGRAVTVLVEGKPITVREGDTAAAAALLAGLISTRQSPVSGVVRAPYCMMGVCFECLMIIDGVSSRQACLTPVSEGMHIERQTSARGPDQ